MKKILLTLLILILPLGVLAQIENPLESDTFQGVITSIITVIWNLAIVVMPLMIIIGGFLFVTAAGDINRIEQAKRLLTWAIVGFIIVALATGAVQLLNQILGVEGVE